MDLGARVDRLEEALVRLAEAQARTEERIGRLEDAVVRLAEAQVRTESALLALAQQVGRLSETIGFTLVDLYGEGQQDGRSIVVVGEVRSRIHGRDVESAVRQAGRLRSQLSGAPVVVLFGFVIHPSARAAAHRLEAIVISSSGRLEP